MEIKREELLKFKWAMEIADILISMGIDKYNETKCLILCREPDEKVRNFYKILYDYADSKRSKEITTKAL